MTAGALVGAQMRIAPLDDGQGHAALGLSLRHLGNTGIFMQATAHPDDEDNALLVMLNRGLGYRTVLATATRGNGGQNEIGPEIFEALGVLRTEELAAMHRFDGAEQYFTRAVDFGYSFSIEETFEKWGRDEILGDFVRLIRTVRPDVMLSLAPGGDGGGQHHQASAILAREAFAAAGDAARYPEQLKDGLRPWQPRKFYLPAGGGAASDPSRATRSLTLNLAAYDPLLGKTYADIGTEARSMHKCQGTSQLLSLPGPAAGAFQLAQSVMPAQLERDETSLFAGVDTTIPGLAQFAGARPPRELTAALSSIAAAVDTAQKRFDAGDDAAAAAPLLTGLRLVRQLRAQTRSLPIEDAARFEIDVRLRQKESEFQQAILVAAGIRVEALADDGVVAPGQPLRVSVIVANRGASDAAIRQVKLEGFDGAQSCVLSEIAGGGGRGRGGFGPGGRGAGGRGRGVEPAPSTALLSLRSDRAGRCDVDTRIPPNARSSEPYWHRAGEAGRYTFDADAPFGLPYRPTPFYAQVVLTFASAAAEEVFAGLPVEYRYGDIVSGEKRSELLVVPAMSVRVSPDVAIMPTSPPPVPVQTAAARGTAGAARGTAASPASRGAAASQKPAPLVAPSREIRVTVVNDTKGPAQSAVKLTLPAGWTSTPVQQVIAFTREDESQTVRFQIRPPAGFKAGEFAVGAIVTAGGQEFARGFQPIEYPHIRRQHIYDAAVTRLQVIDVRTAPNLSVGYVMGVGDEVPQAIAQLGASVTLLTADDLAWGDLARFNTIVTGVRAYERRADLRANNSRLLEYVRNGGTLVVQYNKQEFNEAQYGPYPAVVSQGRVTDEHAPVKIVTPGHPAFTLPNELTEAAWAGWVQERGLYFLGEKDARYRDLVSLADPFPNNPGEKRGALVEAQYGKGRWVYVGLGLWRELPAGVSGAYQLLANLISLK
jgi:LmbE family N-acetylglucosaminyl deacetylase